MLTKHIAVSIKLKGVNNLKEAIIRLVVLVILLINNALLLVGKNPLPYSEEEIYLAVSTVATTVVTLWTYWKNNNITKEAQESQSYLKDLKEMNKNGN